MPRRADKKTHKESASAALRDAGRFLMNTYKRPPVVFTHGKGCTVFDAKGKAYLDRFFPQLDRIISASIVTDEAAPAAGDTKK